MLIIKRQGRFNLHCLSVKSLIQFCYPVWTILFLKLVYIAYWVLFGGLIWHYEKKIQKLEDEKEELQSLLDIRTDALKKLKERMKP